MKRNLWIAGSLVAVAASVWVYLAVFPSEERIIIGRLNELAAASSSSAENPVVRMVQVAGLGRFFTQDVRLQLGPGVVQEGRDGVLALAARWRPSGDMRVELPDIEVQVAPNRTVASVHLTVKVSGRNGNRAKVVDARELEIQLSKHESEWLIESVEAVDPLRVPAPR